MQKSRRESHCNKVDFPISNLPKNIVLAYHNLATFHYIYKRFSTCRRVTLGLREGSVRDT